MSPQVEKLFNDAKSLSPQERIALADQLIDSVDDDDAGEESLNSQAAYETEWSEEISRRVAEMESGEVQGIPWEEVRRKLMQQAEDADED